MSPDAPEPGRRVSFDALDGTPLEGTLLEPEGAPHTALLINSGTGIPQRFYGRFARHAAGRGFAVLTYDYRGIGASAPESLKGYRARYRDWGQQDIPGALAFLSESFPDLPLTALGHSTGGQQLGLAENVSRVRAALFVAVSTGYWRGMPLRYKILSLILWKLYMPLATRVLGYAPSSKIGWGENLPTGVAREWGDWCLEHDYLAAYLDGSGRRRSFDGQPFGPQYYEQATFPLRGYYPTDDPIATRANVPPMLGLYKNAEVETRWVSPEDLGVKEIGHLGLFRPRIGGELWDEALDWLQDQAALDASPPPSLGERPQAELPA